MSGDSSLGIGIGLALKSYGIGLTSFSAEAKQYFDRLDSAGDTTYTAYKQPIANYIDGLVSNSIWDGLKSSALFVGVGFEGIVVPLRSDMPALTSNNFVSGDLSVTSGLSNGSGNEFLATGTDNTDYAQNDVSFSVYTTELPTLNSLNIGTNLANGIGARNSPSSYVTVSHCSQGVTGSAAVGLQGTSRSSSTGYDYRTGQATASRSITSATPAAGNFTVFGTGGNAGSTTRLATYHAGTSINLATLETLQAQLIADIAAV